MNTDKREIGAVEKLIHGLRELSKIGTGHCGGGCVHSEYRDGVRDTENKVREECRKLLKEYEGTTDQ